MTFTGRFQQEIRGRLVDRLPLAEVLHVFFDVLTTENDRRYKDRETTIIVKQD